MTNYVATYLFPIMAKLQVLAIKNPIDTVKELFSGDLWDTFGVDHWIEVSIGDDNLSSILDICFLGSKSGNIYTDYWSAINTALEAVKPLGYAIITTFFLLYMFDLASKDQITFDGIVKLSIQLIAVVAIAGNLNTILNALLSISDSLLSSISGLQGFGKGGKLTSSSSTDYAQHVIDQWKETGDNAISAWFKAIMLWLVHQIAVIGCYFAVFSRALDVGWRIVFAPIGIANSFEGGANSAGVRYLKGLFTSILSGVIIYVVVALGFKVTGGMLVAGQDYAANTFAAQACLLATAGAAIGVSIKSKELIQ